uniref:Uncharacterized protein n=1 Tax=Sphaerodactylus townsendi TaxID=933632 RepID=A0ACB8FXY5_9SAUR
MHIKAKQSFIQNLTLVFGSHGKQVQNARHPEETTQRKNRAVQNSKCPCRPPSFVFHSPAQFKIWCHSCYQVVHTELILPNENQPGEVTFPPHTGPYKMTFSRHQHELSQRHVV